MRTILSCDWGTSNLRVRAVDAESGRVLDEVRSDCGIKPTFDAWRASGADRIDHFFSVLEPLVRRLNAPACDAIIISGMASSSIGFLELPYAEVPFALDGSDIVHQELSRPSIGGPVILLSGVRTESDVMRGEETELIGIWASLDAPPAAAAFVLPGTHSKHVFVEDGRIRDFRTYMTGELFDVLAAHSVLSRSIEAGPLRADAFDEGVETAAHESLQRTLFSVRSGAVLGRRSSASNYWYLSGLLIGAELQELGEASVEHIYLCAGSAHRQLYAQGLETLELKASVVPDKVVEESVARGQLAVYRRLQEREP